MKTEDLCCLIVLDTSFAHLNLMKMGEVAKKPEIDSENQRWKDNLSVWRKIGEQRGGGDIRFVFDATNFDHLKEAIQVTADFHR